MYLLLIAFALLMTACGPSASEIREHKYWSWYQTLTPEQQEREDQRQHERSLAAMQALSRMQMNGPMFSLPPLQPHTAPQYNEWTPTSRTRTNCTTNLYGNQAQTYCY